MARCAWRGACACACVLALLCALARAGARKRADMPAAPFLLGSRYGRSPAAARLLGPRNDRSEMFFLGSRYGKRGAAPAAAGAWRPRCACAPPGFGARVGSAPYLHRRLQTTHRDTTEE